MDKLKNLRFWLQRENPPAEVIDGEDIIASHYRHVIWEREETVEKLDILVQEREEHLEELNILIHEVDETIKTLALKLQALKSKRKNDTGEGEHLMGPQRERKMNCAEVEALALKKNQRKRKREPPTEETKKRDRKMNCAEVAGPAVKRRRV
jgi:recombinational DNA repair ATPase RecF